MSGPGPRVLFADSQLLVAVKPAGWLSQPDGGSRPDVLAWAKEYIRAKHGKPGAAYAGLLHRLDLPVGGVMALARTSKAARRVSGQFRERRVEKIYLALCRGVPRRDSGELRGSLERDGNLTVPSTSGRGTEARLAWKLLSRAEAGGLPSSLLEVNLLTGFKHQIRSQLAGAGLPVWGDEPYGGGRRPEGEPSIGLFAGKLSLDHPVSRERLSFSAMPDGGGWPWRLVKGGAGVAFQVD
ncbi:MAG: RluA family pseudouridine synthase [Deltaproteobacteria bacterium]|jgi:23S rRNA pseudouridine1911/1915/1917 synthase|nr:RluA family pseudouridine synthase [Deltaproteobacteria bacterium]